ncbi:MAG TPA: SRPBCC family protein [Solirubrobacteraceae bacterium]|nr:SRPBCC family protein [Solirubrobacteraceae bacterium]
MKDLAASASGRTHASVDDAYGLLSDFESYPDWFPEGVKSIQVLERYPDGHASRLQARLHTSSGPVQRDFDMEMTTTLRATELVELKRVAHEKRDREEMVVSWRLNSGPQTLVAVDLRAKLDLPGFLPVGGLAQGMADRFLQAALRRLNGA